MKKFFAAWFQESKRPILIAIQVCLLLAVIAYFAYRAATDIEATPCSPGGYPARCYYIKQDMCELLWKKSDALCKGIVQKLSLPPTHLIGPILFKCQLANLDRAFANSRVSSPECDKMKQDLDGWKIRNPDF